MLGKLLASPLLTFNPTASFCPFSERSPAVGDPDCQVRRHSAPRVRLTCHRTAAPPPPRAGACASSGHLKISQPTSPSSPCSRDLGSGLGLTSVASVIAVLQSGCLQHDLAGTTAASTPGCVKPSCIVPVNHISDTRFCISTSKKWKLHSTAQIDNLVLNDEEKKMWDSCRQALSSFKFSVEEEDKILGKAFGYIHTPYWYEERKKEVPQLETVNEILDYLRSLNLTDDDLCKVLKKFPEVLGCGLEDELKNNVQVLSKQWGIEGKTLRNLLLRNPKVLGYNVDCKGDCEAKCTRCWARF